MYISVDGRRDSDIRRKCAKLATSPPLNPGCGDGLQDKRTCCNDTCRFVLVRWRLSCVAKYECAPLPSHNFSHSSMKRGQIALTMECPIKKTGALPAFSVATPSAHSTSLNASTVLVFPYDASLLLSVLSSAVRPNPRWSNENTVMPRA